ncbi:MAG TPA: hypothetical protein VG817_09115, partial [Gemmatimonadales bacterium]|nr:hypothetical protein [Gemmatimonadales bacterium]
YLVWAAMHDIAHGDEGTMEWTVLGVCTVGFLLLYWLALRTLASKARMGWLVGTALLISLFSAGAVSAILRPKYAKDPLLAATFLAVGLPMLGMIAYHLVREAIHKRVGPESLSTPLQ